MSLAVAGEGLGCGQRVCRRITREYARSFYFASHCLPRSVRGHAYAVYGFCRWADNNVDDAGSVEEARRRVAYSREVLERAYSGEPVSGGLAAFRHTVRARGIPRHLFEALLDGMEMDLTIDRYADFPALDLYCYRVAGVVGLMMTHVFGYRDERCFPQAVALGRAMQLTNILRDVREDLERGRVYVPQDELERFGVSEGQLRAGVVDENFRGLMRFQVARARGEYRTAEAGVRDLATASGRVTVRVMGRVYEGILDAIEGLGYNVFGDRARVALPGKLRRLAGCVRDEMFDRG